MEGCPAHYRMFSNIPGLNSLDASSTTFHLWQPQCLQILLNVPGGQNRPWLRTCGLILHSIGSHLTIALWERLHRMYIFGAFTWNLCNPTLCLMANFTQCKTEDWNNARPSSTLAFEAIASLSFSFQRCCLKSLMPFRFFFFYFSNYFRYQLLCNIPSVI